MFNGNFAGEVFHIAEELAAQSVPHVSHRPPIVISAKFRVRPVRLSELGAALRRMSNWSAVGCCGVPSQIVRRCFASLAPELEIQGNVSPPPP